MKILICGINYAPELTGIGKYSGELGAWLASAGLEVRVVTAPPYYPQWRVSKGYSPFVYSKETVDGVEVIRCPLYVPKRPTTITRLVHLISFAFSSFLALLTNIKWRPDVIMVVEPNFFCAPGSLLVGALARSKTVLHIQDYEIDAMFGLGMLKNGMLSKVAFGVESWIMRRFDRISTISYSMQNRAVTKKVNRENVMFFPNWVDAEFITPSACGAIYREKWGVTDQQKVVLYSGNIGEKQGLEIVLDAAEEFLPDDIVKFFIVGQGAYRSKLMQIVKEKRLTNVQFEDLVPYEDLSELMAMADIHLVVQKKGAADAVLPSKLTSILSAGGHSLITAEHDTELGILVENNPGIAVRVEPEEIDEFIDGLKVLLDRDTKKVNCVARKHAVNELSKDKILSRFNVDMHNLCGLSINDSKVDERSVSE